MDERGIDWSTANVDTEGTLTVAIAGDVDDVWMESLDNVLGYLSEETRGGVWGEVEVAPGTIRVTGVEKGSSGVLRDPRIGGQTGQRNE